MSEVSSDEQLRAERVHVELALFAPIEQPVDRITTDVAYPVDVAGFRGHLPLEQGEGVVVHGRGVESSRARPAVFVQVEIAPVASQSFTNSDGFATIA